MRKFIIVAAIYMFSISGLQAQIRWEKSSFKEVLVKAKVLGRKIMVTLYDSSPSSMRLNHGVFKNKTGKKLSDELFCLSYYAKRGEGKELAQQFKVITFPTTLIFDKSGQEIDRVIHYTSPGDFVQTALDYANGKDDLKSLEAYLERKPKDIKKLFTVGEKFAYKGNEPKADKYLGKIVELDPKNSKGYSDRALFTMGKYLYQMSLKNYSKALSLYLELENQFPASPYSKRADLERARIYLLTKRKKEALDSIQNYLLKSRAGKNPNSYVELVKFSLANRFQMDETLKNAKEGVQQNPKSHELLDAIATLYSYLGKHLKAINSERKALKIKPDDPYYKRQLSKFIKKSKKASK